MFDIPERELIYRTVDSPDIKRVALRDFDLDCDAAPVMLDVDAPLAGNVAPDFVPYDADVNLRIFRVAVRRFGIDVSEEAATGLMRHFDRFRCASPPAG